MATPMPLPRQAASATLSRPGLTSSHVPLAHGPAPELRTPCSVGGSRPDRTRAHDGGHDGANEKSRRPKNYPAKPVFPESINTLHDFHRCFDGEVGIRGGDPSESRDGGAAQRGCCVAGMQLRWLRALAYRIVNLDISAKLRSVGRTRELKEPCP
jgi:hypothetical protein